MSYFVGLDLSLTGTGVCVRPGDGSSDDGVVLVLVQTKPQKCLGDTYLRLRQIVAKVTDHVPSGSKVCVEGPSYGSVNGHQHDRSGLWWMIYEQLNGLGCEIVSVPPTSRAMYATGKGNAGKDSVLAAMVRKHPSLLINDNNIADAVALCDMACRFYAHPVDPDLPETHMRAMKGIKS